MNPNDIETWRIYGIEVQPDALSGVEASDAHENPAPPSVSAPVVESLASRLRIDVPTTGEDTPDAAVVLPSELQDARVVRRSLDARKTRRNGGGDDDGGPRYTYVVDIDVTVESAMKRLRLAHKPGRMERLGKKAMAAVASLGSATKEEGDVVEGDSKNPEEVII